RPAARAVQGPGPGAPDPGGWRTRGRGRRRAGSPRAGRSAADRVHQSGTGGWCDGRGRVRSVPAGGGDPGYVVRADAGGAPDRAHARSLGLGVDPEYRPPQTRSRHAGAAHPEDAVLIGGRRPRWAAPALSVPWVSFRIWSRWARGHWSPAPRWRLSAGRGRGAVAW